MRRHRPSLISQIWRAFILVFAIGVIAKALRGRRFAHWR